MQTLQFIFGLLIMLLTGSIGGYYIIHETNIHSRINKLVKKRRNKKKAKKVKKFIRNTMKQFERKMR